METIRVDKWLLAARFYKTRSLAHAACEGGKVDVNGQAAKPSRALRAGDRIHLTMGEWRRELVVTARSVSVATESPQTNDPAAGCSIVPSAHPSPASSCVDSPVVGPTMRAYSWETTSRQTGYCSTRCTVVRHAGRSQTGSQ